MQKTTSGLKLTGKSFYIRTLKRCHLSAIWFNQTNKKKITRSMVSWFFQLVWFHQFTRQQRFGENKTFSDNSKPHVILFTIHPAWIMKMSIFGSSTSTTEAPSVEIGVGASCDADLNSYWKLYLQTTSIFHDVSRKSPVTLGFSALHVMDFPSSSVVGTKLNSLIVTFSRVSCWK